MLLEAVPNVSLGPEDEGLDDVRACLEDAASPGWAWLDEHTDADHARTVLTLAGAPAPLVRVLDGLASVLDVKTTLQGHTGVHPRVGMLDVLPLVPLEDADWADAARVADQLAHRVAARDVPVYRYARSARSPERASLADIRRQVEWFGRSETPRLAPDDGPAHLHPRLGATCIGVRGLLVAYNVLLETEDLDIGRRIARSLRPANGGLEGVQALAFPLASHGGKIQVSTNVTDPRSTSLTDVYARVRVLAENEGVQAGPGELVGLCPHIALPDEPEAAGLPKQPRSLEAHLQAHGLPTRIPAL